MPLGVYDFYRKKIYFNKRKLLINQFCALINFFCCVKTFFILITPGSTTIFYLVELFIVDGYVQRVRISVLCYLIIKFSI